MTSPPWTPEVVVDPARARALITSQFPALRAGRLERLGHGWDNAAYLVDESAVFRFPQRAVAAPLIAREIAVLPHLAARVPLAIPNPCWAGEPAGEYPWAFAGYRFLSGTPLDTASPDEAARRRLAPLLGAFLRALHRVDPAPLLARGLGHDTIRRLDAAKRLPQAEERLRALRAANIVSATTARAVQSALDRDAPREALASAVVHGDLYARHVLLDGGALPVAVIDWGDVHLGDAALDLAIAHEVLPASAHAAFRDAYGPIDEPAWRRARWRALYHAVLVADYGVATGDPPLARGGLDAIARITAASTA